MLDAGTNIPISAVATAALIAGTGWWAAPEVGRRLIEKRGEIARCVERSKAVVEREWSDAKAEVPEVKTVPIPNPIPMPRDTGKGRGPTFDEFMKHYGLQDWMKGLEGLLIAPKVAEAQQQLRVIAARFERRLASLPGECGCQASAAIKAGHAELAMFTASGGLYRTGFVVDIEGAMRAQAAACKGA